MAGLAGVQPYIGGLESGNEGFTLSDKFAQAPATGFAVGGAPANDEKATEQESCAQKG
jgi:hypothetical protein